MSDITRLLDQLAVELKKHMPDPNRPVWMLVDSRERLQEWLMMSPKPSDTRFTYGVVTDADLEEHPILRERTLRYTFMRRRPPDYKPPAEDRSALRGAVSASNNSVQPVDPHAEEIARLKEELDRTSTWVTRKKLIRRIESLSGVVS
jgi:hypothetical protein